MPSQTGVLTVESALNQSKAVKGAEDTGSWLWQVVVARFGLANLMVAALCGQRGGWGGVSLLGGWGCEDNYLWTHGRLRDFELFFFVDGRKDGHGFTTSGDWRKSISYCMRPVQDEDFEDEDDRLSDLNGGDWWRGTKTDLFEEMKTNDFRWIFRMMKSTTDGHDWLFERWWSDDGRTDGRRSSQNIIFALEAFI